MSEPRIFDVRAAGVGGFDVAPVVEHLRSDGLLAYPTETVYGFGGVPNERVIARLSKLKGRPDAKPMLMLVSGREDVDDLSWTEEARELAEVFWPGSVTLILADPTGRFPSALRNESGAVAVRVSPHPIVSTILRGLGGPLLSTSANRSGEPPALEAEQAAASGRELGVGADLWVLDAGALPPSPPSTIIDCSGNTPVVVRQGTIPLGRVRCVLPDIEAAPK